MHCAHGVWGRVIVGCPGPRLARGPQGQLRGGGGPGALASRPRGSEAEAVYYAVKKSCNILKNFNHWLARRPLLLLITSADLKMHVCHRRGPSSRPSARPARAANRPPIRCWSGPMPTGVAPRHPLSPASAQRPALLRHHC
jgi:hypothetical protein